MEQLDWNNEAAALLERQRKAWPLAAANFAALEKIQIRDFEIDGEQIRVQFNPARIISSGAKVDARSTSRRPCFLCSHHLPEEQEKLPIHPEYWLMCNPYPIFSRHFTLPARRHEPQLLSRHVRDFLELAFALSAYTIFYNGPRCGASAPDHRHFQAAPFGDMPLDREISRQLESGTLPRLAEKGEAVLYEYAGALRKGFVLTSPSQKDLETIFDRLYHILPLRPAEEEPRMNAFATYRKGQWIMWVIPRNEHRPDYYFQPEETRIMTSPGAADIGGIFIAPRAEDFARLSPETLQAIYGQVCLEETAFREIAGSLLK